VTNTLAYRQSKKRFLLDCDQACIEDLDEVDIIDEAGDGMGLGWFCIWTW
jgi:hypothetical protein